MKVDAFFSFLPGSFRNVVNEKAALEYALSFSISGRSALVQVEGPWGLSGLFDPLMSSVYMGSPSGLVIYVVSPQDRSSLIRALGFFSKAPVVVSSKEKLPEFLAISMDISKGFEIPVILLGPRPLRGDEVEVGSVNPFSFKRDPARWAATPRFRFELHKVLNRKLADLRSHVEERFGDLVSFSGSGDVFISEFQRPGFRTVMVPFSHPLPLGLVKDLVPDGARTDSLPILWQSSGYLNLSFEEEVWTPRFPGGKGHPAWSNDLSSFLSGFDVVVTDVQGETGLFGPEVVRVPLGSSVGVASGMVRAGRKAISITDDLSFFHSGYPAILNAHYNVTPVKVIVLSHIPDVVVRMVSSAGIKVLRGKDAFLMSAESSFVEVGVP